MGEDIITRAFFLVDLFLFGLVFGSFANVVMCRLPRGESVGHPGSACPVCGHPIRWYDNIPVVSWFVLRGRCRDCGTSISARYPVVELASGFLWLAAGLGFGISVRTAFVVAFFYLLLILSVIDIDTYRLPNTLVGILGAVGVLGVAASVLSGERILPLTPSLFAEGPLASPLGSAGLGLLLGAGVSTLIAVVYHAIRRRAGLGMGDIKLLAAMGLFLGADIVLAYVGGSLLGVVVGIPLQRRGRSFAEDADSPPRIPFGPFLSAGAILASLFAPVFWEWYLGLLTA